MEKEKNKKGSWDLDQRENRRRRETKRGERQRLRGTLQTRYY